MSGWVCTSPVSRINFSDRTKARADDDDDDDEVGAIAARLKIKLGCPTWVLEGG